jgi:hypothetical protein
MPYFHLLHEKHVHGQCTSTLYNCTMCTPPQCTNVHNVLCITPHVHRYGQTECVAPCTLTAPGDPQPDQVSKTNNVERQKLQINVQFN